MHGIVVPGGFGERGLEGKILAAQYARERKIPYIGLCLGLQMMVIDVARNVLGWTDANTTEVDPETRHPVISLLTEQQGITDLGGTMRLGSYPCRLIPGTVAAQAYGSDFTSERHRHRWEFNNAFRSQFEAAGLIASGTSPDGSLVEICELRDHPFMVGSQFHPELRSRPTNPHPLFRAFVGAASGQRRGWTVDIAPEDTVVPAPAR
jgi:CTP synthase